MNPAGAPEVVLATRNPHKVAELREILAATGVAVTLLGTDRFAGLPEIAETGASFEQNAVIKALAVALHTGLPAVADDSGLCVDALGGMPGIFSARWSGSHGDDGANLDLLLAQLADVPDDRRTAHFECAAALATPDGAVVARHGRIDGVLLRTRRGTNGFGYDPVFRPDGSERTTAEMTAGQKNAISHRTLAFRALAKDLAQLL